MIRDIQRGVHRGHAPQAGEDPFRYLFAPFRPFLLLFAPFCPFRPFLLLFALLSDPLDVLTGTVLIADHNKSMRGGCME